MDQNTIEFLVAEWDEVYKKGQLSLWMLLAIYEGEKHTAQIADFMKQATDGSFEVREQSLYRALRRFNNMGLVQVTTRGTTKKGPSLKYYKLTDGGEEVLRRFIAMNVRPLFNPNIVKIFKKMEKKHE